MASHFKPIDLTNDNDDELQFSGSVPSSAPGGQSSISKTLKPFQGFPPQREFESIGTSSPDVFLQDTNNSHRPKSTQATLHENLRNSEWNRVSEPRYSQQSSQGTPSPCTRNSDNHKVKAQMSANGSTESQRKRVRTDSLSFVSKRFRQTSPSLSVYHHDGDDFEIVDPNSRSETSGFSDTPRGRTPTEAELRHNAAIFVVDDDEDDELTEIPSEKWCAPKKKEEASMKLNGDFLLIDLDEQEDYLYREEIRLETSRQRGESPNLPRRNLPITLPWAIEDFAETNIGRLKSGDIVKVKGHGFLRIVKIMKNLETDEIKLRGHQLDRVRNLNGILPKKTNELCWLIDVDLDDQRPGHEQDVADVSLEDISRSRKLVSTNQRFPAGSFRETGGFFDSQNAEEYAQLCLRWKFTCVYRTPRDRQDNRWAERRLEHLRSDDLNKGDLVVPDTKLRVRFRGETILGGAFRPHKKAKDVESPEVFHLDDDDSKCGTEIIDFTQDDVPGLEDVRKGVSILGLSDDAVPKDSRRRRHHASQMLYEMNLSGSSVRTPPDSGMIQGRSPGAFSSTSASQYVRTPGQKYTYGDCFCGAGGTTRGAVMAGLLPVWGFDADHHACASWRLNFPDAIMYHEWAHEFIQRGYKNDSLKVDVLHLSPPCQYFSPAHTVIGKNDEINSASLFASGGLLDVAKPRVVTLEQTFGIVLLPRFSAYFNSLIQIFTDRGFSLRWKVAQLQDWGLPQRRKRLIIIASCPGEALPEFPPFTHTDPVSPSPGLKPWESVNKFLRKIPHNAPNHDLAVVESKPLNYRPWSGDSIAPRCITTHGGQNYHPSGRRHFTNREYASLQGFPISHRFTEYNVKKQIGNAVPPAIAEILFKSIKLALEKADGVEPERFETITIDE